MDLPELEKFILSGRTLEEVAAGLTWQDFEDACASILEEHGFHVKRNFRFKAAYNRYEIDVLAAKDLVKKHGRGACRTAAWLAVDCKHWACGKTSALRSAARMQGERTKALKTLPAFRRKPVITLVVTLFQESIIQEGGVWIVPVFKLNGFLASGDYV